MLYFLSFIFILAGVFLAGFLGLMPIDIQLQIPGMFRFLLFIVGIIIALIGIILPHGRAVKTGTINLQEFGRPGFVNWFYVRPDDTIEITPAVREIEKQTYSKKLDAMAHEVKSYRIFDHTVRFVPEGIGHSEDLGMCLYAMFLKGKHGFNNLREARAGFLSKLNPYDTLSKEVKSDKPLRRDELEQIR